jgi:hypothetical protein
LKGFFRNEITFVGGRAFLIAAVAAAILAAAPAVRSARGTDGGRFDGAGAASLPLSGYGDGSDTAFDGDATGVGDYEGAAAGLEPIGDRKGAETLLSEAYYLLGARLYREGDYVAAEKWLASAAGYKDAAELLAESRGLLSGLEAGDRLRFGGYDWIVLEADGAKALLLSAGVPEPRAYHNTNTGVRWAQSDIRAYLNGAFYEGFGADERARVVETEVTTNANPWYGAEGGGATYDRVFLLSLEEVVEYFGDSGQLGERPAGVYYGLDDPYNAARTAYGADGAAAGWWLRSPGLYDNYAACVYDTGLVNVIGYCVYYDYVGIRPALWLRL